MCEECRRTPCDPRCPNAPSQPRITLCDDCGDDIFADDELYIIHGKRYCSDCITTAKLEGEDFINDASLPPETDLLGMLDLVNDFFNKPYFKGENK